MYQETTHKLMIFRNALKERQVVRNLYSQDRRNNIDSARRTPTNQSPSRQSNQNDNMTYKSKTPTNLSSSPRSNAYSKNHHQISPSSSSTSNSTSTNTNSSSPNHSGIINNVKIHNSVHPLNGNQIVNGHLNELGLIVEEDNENLNMYEEDTTNQNNLNSGSSDQVLIDNNPNNYKSNYNRNGKPGNFKSSSNSSSGSVHTGMISKPIQSSTPTLGVHQPLLSDFTAKNEKIIPKQNVVNTVDSTRGKTPNENNNREGRIEIQHEPVTIENLLYSSDEDTLSENEYDMKNEDDDDDDDFMNHDANNNKDEDVHIQDDDDDDDLDEHDRRILNFTDSRNESNSNREIFLRNEARARKIQPIPPMPRRKFITIHDNTVSRTNPMFTITRSESLKNNNRNVGATDGNVNNANIINIER
jgi:hypothetical protein